MPFIRPLCFACLLVPFLATAQTDTDAEAARARETLRQRAEDPGWIDECFTAGNPFRYCIYLDKPSGGLRVVDQHLQEPYQVYLFDNGPDYPRDGRYRIRLNGKIGYADEETGAIVIAPVYDCALPFEEGRARAGVGCRQESDGEHRWWSGGRWQTIDRQGKTID
ncbi:MAG: WG repeat-containing protein [Achromobacter pulmonis]|uniref:WG repeat-containing protein n=1 Tax=Achromobacter sp. TaxID=134375 RepID=UPI003D089E42